MIVSLGTVHFEPCGQARPYFKIEVKLETFFHQFKSMYSMNKLKTMLGVKTNVQWRISA